VRIGIRDNGPGLSPDQGARLFQAFERLEAGKTQVEGAGVGLALSKRLMDAMGGGIGLESQVGVGSTFWIRLPRAAVQDSVMPAEPSGFAPLGAPASEVRMRKVLYIEDNLINVLVMQAMLERLPDLRLLVATLPALGLKMAVDECPDLILLNIQLPGMDGFEVMRRLRLEEASRAIPVIAVSANAMAGDIERGMALGFVQYLTKPVDLRQLLAAVEAALPAR
jgi:CheY-like chemotaxis protein